MRGSSPLLNAAFLLYLLFTYGVRNGVVQADNNTPVLLFPVYNFWLRMKADESDIVYRKHVNMTIHQIVESTIRSAQRSRQQWEHFHISDMSAVQRFVADPFGRIYRLDHSNIATDLHGRRILVDHGPGWSVMEADSSAFSGPNPIAWAWTPTGWIPITTDPFRSWYPGLGMSSTQRTTTDCDPSRSDLNTLVPRLSSDDGAYLDPCGEQVRRDYALTMSSGMGDIMCAFCQILKNKDCVWKFCSHPEGVYKIKY